MDYLLPQKILQAVISEPWEDILEFILKNVDLKSIRKDLVHFHDKSLEISIGYNLSDSEQDVYVKKIYIKKPNIIHLSTVDLPGIRYALTISIEQNHVSLGWGNRQGFSLKDIPGIKLQQLGYDLDSVVSFTTRYLDNVSNNSYEFDHFILYFKGFLSALACDFEMAKKMKEQRYFSPSELAANYIKKNYYRQDLSVSEISSFVGLTPNYFVNVFKKEFNMTVRQYIIQTRLEASKSLLETQKYLVRDVAKLTGWSNQYYFSSCFKKQYKCSPGTLL